MSMHLGWTCGWIALGLCSVSGCVGDPPPTYAFSLTIVDRDTQEWIGNAEVIAESGEYRTWLVDEFGPGFYWGGYKPGVYTVTISQTGYKTQTLTDLKVLPVGDGAVTGVKGPVLRVELERASGQGRS